MLAIFTTGAVVVARIVPMVGGTDVDGANPVPFRTGA